MDIIYTDIIDYRKAEQITKNKTKLTINKIDLPIISIKGIIYKSNNNLTDQPTYFYDKTSISNHIIKNNKYGHLEYYKLNTEQRLLLLNNHNTKKLFIHLSKKDSSAKIIYIWLQTIMGQISNISDLDLMGLSMDDFMFIMRNKMNITNDISRDFYNIVKKFKNRMIIPIRTSLRQLDQVLMDHLKQLPLKIDGIFHTRLEFREQLRHRLLCQGNTKIEKCDDLSITAISDEIVLFQPLDKLTLLKIEQYNLTQFVTKYSNQKITIKYVNDITKLHIEDGYKYKARKYKFLYNCLKNKNTYVDNNYSMRV